MGKIGSAGVERAGDRLRVRADKGHRAVIVGEYPPEPVGDYMAGPNHVLPTAGAARYATALSVEHFVKKTSLLRYSEAAFRREAADIMRLAEIEGLTAHARSVAVRLSRQPGKADTRTRKTRR